MGSRVLVAYGSRSGATAELAAWIADGLRAGRRAVRIHSAATVGDIGSYDAVVLGGPIYLGRWHRACRDFVRRHRGDLVERPVWLFSSGPLEPMTEANEPLPVADVRALMFGLPARGHRTFGGRLTVESGGLARWWLGRNRTAGDYRDEARVRAWADEIAVDLDLGVERQAPIRTAEPLNRPAARSIRARSSVSNA
jgi:menaquinone-dependent protoporphyrinogen oxidase